jgi:hypothetical protein
MSSSSSFRATPREGVALPIALAAIITIGALIAGVFFASTQEYRVGRNTLVAQRALHGAEVGLNQVVSSWTATRTTGTRVGSTVKLPDTLINGALVQRQYTRISPTVFWVTSTGISGAGDLSLQGRALKRLNAILRVRTPDLRIMGAVTSRGLTEIAGSSKISGTDTVVAGWDCPPGGAQAAGVVVNDSAANMIYSGIKYDINGDPDVKDSTAMLKDTTTFMNFGGFTYDSLAALATKVRTLGQAYTNIAPTHLSPGVCNTSDPNNWGDTSHVLGPRGCESYFPIVHLKGATQQYGLQGNGGGQGIILVDGNLVIAGNFRWTGLIIVKGSTTLAGTASGPGSTGVKIVGGLMSMNRLSPADTNTITGVSNITFSRCVIQQVAAGQARTSPINYRSWADLSF